MKEFYILNKNKIPKAFKFLSITGLVFVSLILLISLFNNKLPNKILIVQIYITAGILFPIFGLVVAYLDWESRNLLKRKKFNNTPLNQLEKIGFTDSYLNEKNISTNPNIIIQLNSQPKSINPKIPTQLNPLNSTNSIN